MKQLPQYAQNILQCLATAEAKHSSTDRITIYDKFKKELFDESLTAKANPGPATENPKIRTKKKYSMSAANEHVHNKADEEAVSIKLKRITNIDPSSPAFRFLMKACLMAMEHLSAREITKLLSLYRTGFSFKEIAKRVIPGQEIPADKLVLLLKHFGLDTSRPGGGHGNRSMIPVSLKNPGIKYEEEKLASMIKILEDYLLQPHPKDTEEYYKKQLKELTVRLAELEARKNPNGKKAELTPKQIERILDRYNNGESLKEIAPTYGLHAVTIAKIIRASGHKVVVRKTEPNPSLMEKPALNKQIGDAAILNHLRVKKTLTPENQYKNLAYLLSEPEHIIPSDHKETLKHELKKLLDSHPQLLDDPQLMLEASIVELKKTSERDFDLLKQIGSELDSNTKSKTLKDITETQLYANKWLKTASSNPKKRRTSEQDKIVMRRKAIAALPHLIEKYQREIQTMQHWQKEIVIDEGKPTERKAKPTEKFVQLIQQAIDQKHQVMNQQKARLAKLEADERSYVPSQPEVQERSPDSGKLNKAMGHEMLSRGVSQDEARKIVLKMLSSDPSYYDRLFTQEQLELFGQKNPTQKKFTEIDTLYYKRFSESPLGRSLNDSGSKGLSRAKETITINSERRRFFDRIRIFAVDCAEAIMRSNLLEAKFFDGHNFETKGYRTGRSDADQKELYQQKNVQEFLFRQMPKKDKKKYDEYADLLSTAGLAPDDVAAVTAEQEKLLRLVAESSKGRTFLADISDESKRRNQSGNKELMDQRFKSGGEYISATGSKHQRASDRTLSPLEHVEKLKNTETFRYRKLLICAMVYGMIEPLYQFEPTKIWELFEILKPSFGVSEKQQFMNFAKFQTRSEFTEVVVNLLRKRESAPLKDSTLNDLGGLNAKGLLEILLTLAKKD